MDPKFCLKRNEVGDLHLSTTHDYYDQVQGQLAVCDAEYCDFVCWTPCGIHYERIEADTHYFFNDVKPALDAFFVQVLLPRYSQVPAYVPIVGKIRLFHPLLDLMLVPVWVDFVGVEEKMRDGWWHATTNHVQGNGSITNVSA